VPAPRPRVRTGPAVTRGGARRSIGACPSTCSAGTSPAGALTSSSPRDAGSSSNRSAARVGSPGTNATTSITARSLTCPVTVTPPGPAPVAAAFPSHSTASTRSPGMSPRTCPENQARGVSERRVQRARTSTPSATGVTLTERSAAHAGTASSAGRPRSASKLGRSSSTQFGAGASTQREEEGQHARGRSHKPRPGGTGPRSLPSAPRSERRAPGPAPQISPRNGSTTIRTPGGSHDLFTLALAPRM
jgi:hypothetical protein